MADVTVEMVRASRMRQRAHLNGGREWFGYLYQCIEFPRLERVDRYMRKDRSVVSTWRVDGEELADLAVAAEKLSVPAVFTEEEAAVLAKVPLEFTNLRQVETLIGGEDNGIKSMSADSPKGRAIAALAVLNMKGALEYGRSPDTADGQPWADSMPEHLRYTPTVRRRAPP